MNERERDRVEEVSRDLDTAEEQGDKERLDTLERIHRELEDELESGDDAPPPGR